MADSCRNSVPLLSFAFSVRMTSSILSLGRSASIRAQKISHNIFSALRFATGAYLQRIDCGIVAAEVEKRSNIAEFYADLEAIEAIVSDERGCTGRDR